MNEYATIITAVATLITALALLASTLLNARKIRVVDTKVDVVDTKIDEVHTEIKTANGLTLAQLGDNDETRRISKIPKGKQTTEEKVHLTEVPNKQ